MAQQIKVSVGRPGKLTAWAVSSAPARQKERTEYHSGLRRAQVGCLVTVKCCGKVK